MNYRISKGLTEALNCLLACESSLYFKTKKAHWLAEGIAFQSLHEMLDDQAEVAIEGIDAIAERIVALGGLPLGSLSEMEKHAKVSGFPSGKQSTAEALAALLTDQEGLVLQFRKGIEIANLENDPGTSDLLTELVQKHEKAAWYLRATLGRS